ncbi:MAG: TSUP family transporter [Spirochaetaceae bacterium]|nr:TSUP family transporter [Spirochaetaceae bacterium]
MHILVFLFPLIFLAGFIDSIAGGGGLISLTAYLAFGIPSHVALGTNKFAACSGTTVAVGRYIKSKQIDVKICIFSAITALIGSSIGSHLTLLVSDFFIKYLLLVAAPILAILTISKKDSVDGVLLVENARVYIICALISLVIGAYDGFFGPGTGMFLIFFFTTILHMDIKKACGNAKVINLASNIAALSTFVINGNINYKIAIPCAFAQVVGSYIGSGFAIRHGSKVVKPIMLIVIFLLLIKVVYDLFF